MKSRRTTLVFAAIIVVFLFAGPTIGSSGNAALAKPPSPFFTSTAPYITMANTSDSVKPIITAGDTVNGYTMQKIPDGLGAVKERGNVVLYMNHEQSGAAAEGGFSHVSRLTLSGTNAGVLSGEYLIDGTEGYERLCSAFLATDVGKNPVFLTGEEVDNGVIIGVKDDGQKVEMPWLGLFAHENQIVATRYLSDDEDGKGKIVILEMEDGSATKSELYMYIANSTQDLFGGKGKLYVFAADDSAHKSFKDIYYSTGAMQGHFVPLNWNHTTQNNVDLQNEAASKGAFEFVRLEDGAFDKRPEVTNIMYFADTGNDKDNTGALITPGANGQLFKNGRIYKLELGASDPTEAAIRVIADGDDPTAPGYNFMHNPDNLDISKNSLMIQEDPNGYNRLSPTESPYDITRNAKVIQGTLDTIDSGSATLNAVAYVNQSADLAAKHGEWESSGIIDTSKIYGKGTWMLDVQAHSISEGGQLLVIKVADS